MSFLWFGDSWSLGVELGTTQGQYSGQLGDRLLGINLETEQGLKHYLTDVVKRSRPDLAFPALVTKELKLDSYYFTYSGATISRFFHFLLKWLNRPNRGGDIALFALPTPWSRYYYIDNLGQEKAHYNHRKDDNLNRVIHQDQLERGKYDITIMLNLLYSTCVINNIRPYFISCWKPVEVIEDIFIVPKENILLPLTTTMTDISWEQTRLNPTNLNIYPNTNHPNLEGQQKLAKTLIPYINEII